MSVQIQGNAIDYGTIKNNTGTKRQFKVTNNGDKDLRVTDLGRSCSCTTVSSSSSTLHAKDSITFDVTLTPTSTGLMKRSFWFTLSNGNHYNIDLRANVIN